MNIKLTSSRELTVNHSMTNFSSSQTSCSLSCRRRVNHKYVHLW